MPISERCVTVKLFNTDEDFLSADSHSEGRGHSVFRQYRVGVARRRLPC